MRTYNVDLLPGFVLGVVLTIVLTMVLNLGIADDAIMTTQNTNSSDNIVDHGACL